MSAPEQDDHQDDDRGGEVVPFPGGGPEVAPGAGLEPAPEPLEGEIVGEEEYARRTGVHRYTPIRVVRLVTVVRASERTTGAGRDDDRSGVRFLGPPWLGRGHVGGVPAADRGC